MKQVLIILEAGLALMFYGVVQGLLLPSFDGKRSIVAVLGAHICDEVRFLRFAHKSFKRGALFPNRCSAIALLSDQLQPLRVRRACPSNDYQNHAVAWAMIAAVILTKDFTEKRDDQPQDISRFGHAAFGCGGGAGVRAASDSGARPAGILLPQLGCAEFGRERKQACE
ncbi:hypothetical protein [Bradyrhizobium sp. Leo170]|uniref:hypothetical protein n=1 Tax=Bradyrhizobium sp. Leo170 TaxID=1571199 RepID=UPI00102E99B7|nr:hypothetical protein [Bradyrhizobium sp. Leo170]